MERPVANLYLGADNSQRDFPNTAELLGLASTAVETFPWDIVTNLADYYYANLLEIKPPDLYTKYMDINDGILKFIERSGRPIIIGIHYKPIVKIYINYAKAEVGIIDNSTERALMIKLRQFRALVWPANLSFKVQPVRLPEDIHKWQPTLETMMRRLMSIKLERS